MHDLGERGWTASLSHRVAMMGVAVSVTATKESDMVKTSACHSTNQDDPDVYHDHTDCPSGSQIPAKNRETGTGGHRRCETCQSMD